MSDQIAPVLTPEEWANEGVELFDGLVDLDMGIVDVSLGGPASSRDGRDCRALAALLLNGQPFGFTWERVDKIRAASAYLRRAADGEGDWYASEGDHYAPGYGGHDLATSLDEVADLIASLLPPRQ